MPVRVTSCAARELQVVDVERLEHDPDVLLQTVTQALKAVAMPQDSSHHLATGPAIKSKKPIYASDADP